MNTREFVADDEVQCIVTGRLGVVVRVLFTTPDHTLLIRWANGRKSVERATMLRHTS